MAASSFDSFEGAVKSKIGREITDVPEPATFVLILAAGALPGDAFLVTAEVGPATRAR